MLKPKNQSPKANYASHVLANLEMLLCSLVSSFPLGLFQPESAHICQWRWVFKKNVTIWRKTMRYWVRYLKLVFEIFLFDSVRRFRYSNTHSCDPLPWTVKLMHLVGMVYLYTSTSTLERNFSPILHTVAQRQDKWDEPWFKVERCVYMSAMTALSQAVHHTHIAVSAKVGKHSAMHPWPLCHLLMTWPPPSRVTVPDEAAVDGQLRRGWKMRGE